jgi:hypothetical protein
MIARIAPSHPSNQLEQTPITIDMIPSTNDATPISYLLILYIICLKKFFRDSEEESCFPEYMMINVALESRKRLSVSLDHLR